MLATEMGVFLVGGVVRRLDSAIVSAAAPGYVAAGELAAYSWLITARHASCSSGSRPAGSDPDPVCAHPMIIAP